MYLTELAWQTHRPSPAPWQEVGQGGVWGWEPGTWCQENPPPPRLTTTPHAGSGAGEAAVKISRRFQPERRGEGQERAAGLVCRLHATSSATCLWEPLTM